jgi:hypothetical protein
MFSLETAMRMLPDSFFPTFIQKMDILGDRNLHDLLSAQEIKIFNTEEGVLSSELGVYRAETVTDKNVRGARGRFKMYGDDEEVVKPSANSRQVDNVKKDVSKTAKSQVILIRPSPRRRKHVKSSFRKRLLFVRVWKL